MRIKLTNWQCHHDFEINSDEAVTIFTGKNGAGKTAIRDAIEFLYLGTGQLRGINRKKDLGALSISDGAAKCTVEIEFDDGKMIRRQMKPPGGQKVELRDSAGSALYEVPVGEVDTITHGVHEDLVRIILDPEGWFALADSRKQELLIAATSDGLIEEEAVYQALISRNEWPEPDLLEVESVAKHAAAHGFRAAEELAITKRKEAKRAKEEASRSDTAPPSEFDGVDLKTRTLEKFETKLKARQEQREAAIAREATDIGALQGKATEAYDALQAMYGEPLEGTSADTEAPDKLSKAEEKKTATLKTLGALMIDIEALEKRIESLSPSAIDPKAFSKPKTCPASPVPFKCPVKVGEFRTAIKEGQKATAADAETIQALKAELLEKQEAAEGVAGDVDELSDWIDRLMDKVSDLNRAQAAVKEHHAKVDAQEKRVAEADKALKEAQEQSATPEGEPSVEELGIMVQKGLQVVEAKKAWDAFESAGRARDTRLEQLTAEVKLWDTLAKEMAPGGVQASLAEGAESAFLKHLRATDGLTPEIEITGSHDLRVGPERRHLVQMSHSQKHAVMIRLQVAFAISAGFPLVCCDAIDRFDTPTKKAWTEIMTDRDRVPLEVLAMSTQSKPPANALAGRVMVWLGDGITQVIE